MNPQGSEENGNSAITPTTRRGSAKPWWALSVSYFLGMLLFLWWARSGTSIWVGIVVVLGVVMVTGSFSVILANRERRKFGYYRLPENSSESPLENSENGCLPDVTTDSALVHPNTTADADESQESGAEIHSIEKERVELQKITTEINAQEDQLHTGTGN